MPCCCSRVCGWHQGWPRMPVFQIAKASARVATEATPNHRSWRGAGGPAAGKRHLQPQRHDDLDPERRVARVAEHRHAAAAQVHRHPGDHGEHEHHREEPRATVHEPHQRVGQGEPRHEVHAQQVEVPPELALGGVHRHRPRPEQHHQHGVGRRESRVGTQGDAEPGAHAGVPGDGQPGDDEAEVAPRVGRLADPPGPGRLAEAVAAADVRAEPAPARGGHHEGEGHDRRHRGHGQGSQVAPGRRRARARPRASSRRQPHHRAPCGATGRR